MEDTSAEDTGGLTGLFQQLVRLEIELWNAVDRRLRAELDTPLGRFETLRAIAGAQPCRVNDVAAAMVITVGGVSKLVDRLEAGGLVRRTANPGDRRSSLLGLTDDGRAFLTRATSVVEAELEQRMGAALTADQRADLAATVARLRTTSRA